MISTKYDIWGRLDNFCFFVSFFPVGMTSCKMGILSPVYSCDCLHGLGQK